VYGNAVAAFAAAEAAAVSQGDAAASSVAAASSAAAAAASLGASAWVSGANYLIGDRRWSQLTQRVYERRTVGAGVTDPSADSVNWRFVAGQRPVYRQVTGASATAAVGEWLGLANAAVTTATIPASLSVGDEIWVTPENGRSDNRIDLNGNTFEGSSATHVVIGDATETARLINLGGSIGIKLIY